MPSINSNRLTELEFKIPAIDDIEHSAKFHALTSKQYLDLIECSIKLLPDIKAARQRSMLNSPVVRFSL